MTIYLRNLLLAVFCFIVIYQPVLANGDAIQAAVSSINANVIFMRHALAPGFGDPDHFTLDDCTTQRNLSQSGIRQASEIGRHLKDTNLPITTIYSSQWCRCLDTASSLNLGDVVPFAGLNSFFEDHVDRDDTLRMLQTKLDSLDHQGLVLMITHQVVISAITDIYTSSGGMVAYNTTTGVFRVIQP
jgi:broad specificity phosphatase PhoE